MTHPSAAFARELVAALAAQGCTDFVLSPGSRSGPLAHALAAAASPDRPAGAPEVQLHVRIDERSAAFVALGIARARALSGSPRPVAVVTTSGTAVGNLMPAVMEAHHTGVPLVLLTADRPGDLRGVGANQTTDHEGVFGGFVRWDSASAAPERGERGGRATLLAARAVHWALGRAEREEVAGTPGPVHLNLEFREPLGHDGGDWPVIDPERPTLLDRARGRLQAAGTSHRGLPDAERCLVIAGDGAGDVARRVAEAHGWPLFAEPTSGARTGSNAMASYLAALETAAGRELATTVTQVVVIGRPTLSRAVQRLIADAPSLYVAAHGARWREAPRHAARVVRTVPDEWLQSGPVAPAWLDPDGRESRWLGAWRRACAGLGGPSEGWGGRVVAETFIASLRAGHVAVLGSSGPIREVDAVAPAWEVGAAPVLLANRGLSGIDGTTSTAMGVALALERPVSALMGDVTFLHDAGGLLVGREERRPDLRIVVVNDDGGTIFGKLEHAKAPRDVVRRVFTTPPGVNLADLASAYRAGHVAVRSREELAAVLATPPVGVEVVEAVV